MPPKIVYGKKRAAQGQQTSFAKFVAQGQDGGAEKKEEGVVMGACDSDSGEGAGIESLEKSLKALDISRSRSPAEETRSAAQPKSQESCRRSKEARAGKGERSPRKDGDSGVRERDAESKGTREGGSGKQGRRGRPRKALKDCDMNEGRDVKEQDEHVAGKEDVCVKKTVLANDSCAKPARRKNTKRIAKDAPKVDSQPDDIYAEFVGPLLPLSLGKCITPFSQWSAELEPHFTVSKIAEASFSEVYRLSAKSTANLDVQESVLKVVALKTPPKAPLPCQISQRSSRNGENVLEQEKLDREEADRWKSEVVDVLSEVKLLRNLNQIPGFTNFRDLTLLQGRPPPAFSRAWTAWNKSRPRGMKSEFPNPSQRGSYDDNQLWAVIEMQDAGTDCEKLMEDGELCSIWAAWDVFWGVCLSVAKAEEMCRFEHRDLHMGNICVRPSKGSKNYSTCTIQDPVHRKFRFTGLETTVIDYTLSRADILCGYATQDVAYLDLDKDPALFEGDASAEYQYEIYRYMRGVALYNDPLRNGPVQAEPPTTPRRSPRKNTHIRFDDDHVSAKPHDVWRASHPKTNLVWMHFLLVKLLKHLSSSGKVPSELSEEEIMSDVEATDDNVEPRKIKQKALKLFKTLHKANDLLSPIALGKHDSLGSVKELVVLALEQRWLKIGDVSGL